VTRSRESEIVYGKNEVFIIAGNEFTDQTVFYRVRIDVVFAE